MGAWPTFLLALAALSCCTSSVLALTTSLVPDRDTTLFQKYLESLDETSGGGQPYFYVGRISQGALRRGLLFFDVNRYLPEGTTVTKASLSLYLDKTKMPTSYGITVHRLLRSWGEGSNSLGLGQGQAAKAGDATWAFRFLPDTPWTTPGGDYVSTASGTTSVTASFDSYVVSGLAADVQLWINNPNNTRGWVIRGDEAKQGEAHRFMTREATDPEQRPSLDLEYTLPSFAYGACCMPDGTCQLLRQSTCTSRSGIYNNDGSTCVQQDCKAVTVCTPAMKAQGICGQGACCLNDERCGFITDTVCATSGGTFLGEGVECTASLCLVKLTPFVDPLPIPVVAQPVAGTSGGVATYDIKMQVAQTKLHQELPGNATVWTYNGLFPGPTVEAWVNRPVTIRWTNDLRNARGQLLKNHVLPVETCMHGPSFTGTVPFTMPHVHGAHTESQFDGHPDFQFPPGETREFVYPNGQRASTMWYHDHALGLTRLNVYMGLAGFYLLRNSKERSLKLPSGRLEVPLVIQDRDINRDGSLRYSSVWTGMFAGRHLLVNGKVNPYLNVTRETYRFRVLNGANSRVFNLRLSNSKAVMHVIGSDRGLLARRVGVTNITITPGERYDILVDFSGVPAGSRVTLQNFFAKSHSEGILPVGEAVMQFRVLRSTPVSMSVSRFLDAPGTLSPTSAARTRVFRLQQKTDTCGGKAFKMNSRGWDDITEFPRLGDTEVWEWVNMDAGHIHPMHIHLVDVQIVSRQRVNVTSGGRIVRLGAPQLPSPIEASWKDTVRVGPLESVKVIAKFDTYTGRFPYHCHVLEHEDHDMMRQFWVINRNCNKNGICEAGEDCYSCPQDCAVSSGAKCGNGICEAGDGENCVTCPQDCAGNSTTPDQCCGGGLVLVPSRPPLYASGCSLPQCTANGLLCRDMPVVASCCGDGICLGAETSSGCPIDCR